MSRSPRDCFYLTVDIVLAIHQEAIVRFGGSAGVRDQALLESAVAAPQATFGGESLFGDLIEIAAAYYFYLCCNHPFVDGNKRAALGASLVFLKLNGVQPAPDGPEWEQLTMDIAAGRLDRPETTKRLRRILTDRG